MAKFSSQHYNAIAKDIREEFPIDLAPLDSKYDDIRNSNLERRTALVSLALRFAKRFVDDNDRFDPVKFLNACSPDADMFPLGELWSDDARF